MTHGNCICILVHFCANLGFHLEGLNIEVGVAETELGC